MARAAAVCLGCSAVALRPADMHGTSRSRPPVRAVLVRRWRGGNARLRPELSDCGCPKWLVFAAIVRKGLWANIAQRDEEAARWITPLGTSPLIVPARHPLARQDAPPS
jgi:hypothetical protein